MADPLSPSRRASADAPDGDALLNAYVASTSADLDDHLLGELLHRHARPIVTAIVRRKGGAGGGTDAEDVVADVLARLLTHLVALKSDASAERITSLSAYVATAAHNGWHRYLRERYPTRTRLKNRLRYIASQHPQLALWTDASGAACCGPRGSQGRSPSHTAADLLSAIERDPRSLSRADGDGWQSMNEAELAAAIIMRCGGPVLLDDLVGVVSSLRGIADERPVTGAGREDEAFAETIADSSPGVLTVLAERQHIQWLWQEVLQLSVRQRTALLLNLRDAEGRGVIGLLPFTGTASMREIATALEIPVSDLASMWNGLPLDDHAIAGRLGITRQQVINLRKCARERLARRSRAHADGSTAVRSASSLVRGAPGSGAGGQRL